MRNILYTLAVILIIGWLLGLFAFNAGGLIHILIVIAEAATENIDAARMLGVGLDCYAQADRVVVP